MRVIPPPVTEREISVMMAGTLEKLVGEIEARMRRRVSYAYTERERQRDQKLLARAHLDIEEHRRIVAVIDAADFLRCLGADVRWEHDLWTVYHPDGVLARASDDTLVGLAAQCRLGRAA